MPRSESLAAQNPSLETGYYQGYLQGVLHEWLTRLTLAGAIVVPLGLVLDAFLVPTGLLWSFALFRLGFGVLALGQFFLLKFAPPRALVFQGALFSLLLSVVVSLMTAVTGGWDSPLWAGLILVMVAANVLTPWGGIHTVTNVVVTLATFVVTNLVAGHGWEASLPPTLGLLVLAGALVATVSFIRARLVQRDFHLLADLRREKALVEVKNDEIKKLLDVSGQGFLSFHSDFLVDPECSRECAEIFEGPIAGVPIDGLLFGDSEQGSGFRQTLGLLFYGKLSSELAFARLAHRYTLGQRTLAAQYRMLAADQVLLVLTDVTEVAKMHADAQAQAERNTRLLRVISYRKDYVALVAEATRVLGHEPHLRETQTFQANAGFLGFTATQAAPPLPLHRIAQVFAEENATVTNVLGPHWLAGSDDVEVDRADYLRWETSLKKDYPTSPVGQEMEALRRRPLSDLFVPFPALADAAADRFGKRLAPLQIATGTLKAFPENYRALADAFRGVVRYLVESGIEAPDKRAVKGKPFEGTLTISCRPDDGGLLWEVGDDGQGLAIPGLGIESLTALQYEAHHRGGRLEVRAFPDRGTTFAVWVPRDEVVRA